MESPQFFKRGPGLFARLVFFVLLSLSLMAVDSRFQHLAQIRSGVATVIYPLQKLVVLPIALYHRAGDFFSTQSQLIEDLAALKSARLEDSSQLQRYLALEAENRHLRDLLGMRQRVDAAAVNATAAEILYLPQDPFSRKITLDQGSQAGLVSGQVVMDGVGVIGQITRVFPWLSEVTLITDKDHSVPVQVQRNGLRSVVFGSGEANDGGEAGGLEMRYLAVSADIQQGDLLVTSGIDGLYPPGLPVAVVTGIERNAAYAFARIKCTPAAGVGNNRQVLILSPLPAAAPPPLAPAEAQPKNKKTKRIR